MKINLKLTSTWKLTLIFEENFMLMKTNKKTKNAGSLLDSDSNKLIDLGRNEMMQISGGGYVIEAYYENGELKFRYVYR